LPAASAEWEYCVCFLLAPLLHLAKNQGNLEQNNMLQTEICSRIQLWKHTNKPIPAQKDQFKIYLLPASHSFPPPSYSSSLRKQRSVNKFILFYLGSQFHVDILNCLLRGSRRYFQLITTGWGHVPPELFFSSQHLAIYCLSDFNQFSFAPVKNCHYIKRILIELILRDT